MEMSEWNNADSTALKLVVGLGNPGRKYAATRHNVGFAVAEVLAGRYGAGNPRAKFHGEMVEINVNRQRGLLLCPHTYMNRSGLSVLKARDFFKVEPADIMIVCDDFNLPLGKLRCRAKGSAGGQKGLGDIFRCLGTDRIPRLRVGIGIPPEGWDVSGYVLSKFAADELPLIRQAIDRAADAVAVWAQDGIEVCMNQYNVDPTLSE